MTVTVHELAPFVFDDAAEVKATFALAMQKKNHPELAKKLAKAQLKLVAAIAHVDEHPEDGWAADAELTRAMQEHLETLAALVRGEDNHTQN